MSDPFLAEIRMVPFNFPPIGWAFCDGQLMAISQNTALFALLGTTYGGDGKSTFALPDLQGAAPLHPGQGQGLSQRFLGEMSGAESVTLLASEIPVHAHSLAGTSDSADDNDANSETTFAAASGGALYNGAAGSDAAMSPFALAVAGGGLPHNNLQPYLVVTFVIAMQGIFPQRP
jgi:microcystin-dependent protein